MESLNKSKFLFREEWAAEPDGAVGEAFLENSTLVKRYAALPSPSAFLLS